MSLQDESFPTDELFDQLLRNKASGNPSMQRKFSTDHDEQLNFERNASPFLNGDCSQKTCVSDPIGLNEDLEEENHANKDDDSHINPQLGTGCSSKAVSYQDIHSAYTKRRYKHVPSKVGKYISDMQEQDQQRRNTKGTFTRHRSMPECLTPRGEVEEHTQLDTSLSQANSSVVDNQSRDESYERLLNENNRLLNEKDQLLNEKDQLLNEKDQLQTFNDYLEAQLHKKVDENLLLKRNFGAARDELDNLKRQGGTPAGLGHPLRSLLYYPPFVGGVAKATQTDLPSQQSTVHNSNLSHLSIAANAIPHPHFGDITYDTSIGSIEIPLLSVPPAARQLNPNKPIMQSIKPLSLNFTNDSAEVDAERGAIDNAQNEAAGNLQPSSSKRIATNNSGSSHPSSNDSAIEVEGHELRSPLPLFRGQTITYAPMGNWGQSKNKIFFDKRSNRVLELVELNQAETSANANDSSISMNIAFSQNNRRHTSLTSRMLRLFGPCSRCDDPNRSLDTTNATYTVGHSLLNDDSNPSRDMR